MTAPQATYRPRSVWVYVVGLTPVMLVWGALAIWLAVLIFDRATISDSTDEASLREWLDEARIFRKTLPELIRETVSLLEAENADADKIAVKREEIGAQLQALMEPLRIYQNQLPIFPEVYRVEVFWQGNRIPFSVEYDSGLPRPRVQTKNPIRTLLYSPLGVSDKRVTVKCEYRVHALNRLQQREEDRQRRALLAEAVLAAATILAGLFVARFLRRERKNEMQRLEAVAAAEHRDRELAESRLRQEAIEREKDRLDRELLRKQLDAKELEARASAAEAKTAEMKTHLFANIGIMAGSYAHNIKNLLVRPNDLLTRCVEADGLTHDQAEMISEVRSTLGTVTDRLQQILATVRRDPKTDVTSRMDLNRLITEAVTTWSDLARDKWKLNLIGNTSQETLYVNGDSSNLHQVLENFIFNARDATFEMRNHLRELARSDSDMDSNTRRERLLSAAAWKGEIAITAFRNKNNAILEVRDNGIGMTEEVKSNCLDTHFTTKRDNALYEGHAAGMGLGLSFVAVVLEHHGAKLDIESTPLNGSMFRVTFPLLSQ